MEKIKTYSYLKLHGVLLGFQLFILWWELSFPISFTSNEVIFTQFIMIFLHLLGNVMFNYLEDNGKIIEFKIWRSDKYLENKNKQ